MKFPCQLLGLLVLWIPGKDGGETGKQSGSGRVSAADTTAPHVYFVQVLETYVLPSGKGHVMFRSWRVRNISEGTKIRVVVRSVT